MGSFDDDASYILTAKALLAGQGLTGHLTSGMVVVGLYAPGFSAVIAPLVWLWPHTYLPLRLFSVGAFAAIFPLTWLVLARRRVRFELRVAVLVLLALGPPLATYGSMVMAEATFLVTLLLLFLALDAWMAAEWVLSRWVIAVIGLSAALIWIKEAGLGLVGGLGLYLLFGRHPQRLARTALVGAGVALTLVPVLVARLVAGIPIAGSRYSLELGAYYQGGLLNRLVHVFPGSVLHLLATAIPATLVPYLDPLPIGGPWPDLWKVLSWQVTILAAVGAVVWVRRYRDAAAPMLAVYLLESALWPFVNERRAILVLPVLTAWYVLGAARVWTAVRAWLVRRRSAPAQLNGVRTTAVILVVAVVAGPLVAQMPRDYLFGWGQNSSQFGGSRYAALLRRLGPPSAVVETDYRSSTALFTGHATNWTAFTVTQGLCYLPGILQALEQDRAAFLLLGDFNKPGVLDSPCLAGQVPSADWAVPLLHTRRDNASVYELVGAGTGHPGLREVAAQPAPEVVATPAGATATLRFASPSLVSQVSVGDARLGRRSALPTVSQVSLQLETAGHTWRTVAATTHPVGGSASPFLVASLPRPQAALAVRVVIRDGAVGGGAAAPAVIRYLAAVGPS